jgi:hypothetical protein
VLHLRDEPLQEVAASWALERERPDVVADLLDPDVVAADAILEIGEVRLGAGQQELVLAESEDHAVLDDEAAVVEPAGVLGVARLAGTDVAGEDTGQKILSALAGDAVLVERARVEEPGRIADREVLELVGHLVAVRSEMAGPVAPELRPVQGVRSLVERGAADRHRPRTIPAIGRLRNIVLRCGRDHRLDRGQGCRR